MKSSPAAAVAEIVARQEQSGQPSCEKKRDETESKEHRGRQLDLTVPESAEPAHQQNRRGQTQGRSQQRENER